MSPFLVILVGGLTLVGLLAAAFVGPSVDKASARRLEAVRFRHGDSERTRVEAQMKRAITSQKRRQRREGEKSSRLDQLAIRLDRTGKSWTLRKYLMASAGLALVVALLLMLRGAPLVLALLIGTLIGLGLPHMAVGFLIKRRLNRFNATFPDAIELLVRGLRSGLPVSETIGVVASEIDGPVGEEFQMIVDRVKIGIPMDDAIQESARRLNTPEFKFFGITLAIQRETGGNLAETLSNLADVLRKRAQMKLKIRAMSSESKASAYIVGALPFIVFALVWFVNPGYLANFFVDERLIVAGLGGLTWMGIGVFIMAKMVSFEI